MKKLLFTLIATLTVSLSLGGIAACGHTHEYGEWETIVEATCTQKGEKIRDCSCGEEQIREIEALGHSFANGVCSVCGTTQSSEPDNPTPDNPNPDNPNPDNPTPYPEATEGLEYTLNEDGESYSVTGIGTATDTEIVIATTYKDLPVTSIGDYAFVGVDIETATEPTACANITSITIPQSITIIGVGAFARCISLKNITIPNSVTSIGEGVFSGCSSLENIIVPDSVTLIGAWAFLYCNSLTSITIPESITSIGDSAFGGCYKLREILNKSSLNIIAGSRENGDVGYYALNVYTPQSGQSYLVTTSDGYVFYDDEIVCYLIAYIGNETEITLPQNFKGKNYEIYDNSLAFYSRIESIYIPNSITTIGEAAFEMCGLTSIVIPDSVTSIGTNAFFGCENLESVTIGNGMASIDGHVFQECENLKNVIIGNSVTTIGDYAFGGCDSLESITIGNGVTTIGEYAFSWCSSLESINFNGTMVEWNKITKDNDWSINSGNFNIICINGTLDKNGNQIA